LKSFRYSPLFIIIILGKFHTLFYNTSEPYNDGSASISIISAGFILQ
jgi:hypothetical protein